MTILPNTSVSGTMQEPRGLVHYPFNPTFNQLGSVNWSLPSNAIDENYFDKLAIDLIDEDKDKRKLKEEIEQLKSQVQNLENALEGVVKIARDMFAANQTSSKSCKSVDRLVRLCSIYKGEDITVKTLSQGVITQPPYPSTSTMIGSAVSLSRAQKDKAAKIKFLETKTTDELVNSYWQTSNLKTIKLIRGVLKRRGMLYLIKGSEQL